MRNSVSVYLLLIGLMVSAGALTALSAAPNDTARPADRTAVPTWTLPFSLQTPTPQPITEGKPGVGVGAPAATLPLPTALPPTAVPPTAVPPTPTPAAPPRLIIPELEVDQSIIPVLIVDGVWQMDHLDEQVGWLTTTGQAPGGELAVTLAGHVNISLGNAGPFLDLGKLKVDDQVIYQYEGIDYVYAVRGQETVKPEAVDALYVADGSRLLLVTCSSWSYFWGHYASRLIVTAELISSAPSS